MGASAGSGACGIRAAGAPRAPPGSQPPCGYAGRCADEPQDRRPGGPTVCPHLPGGLCPQLFGCLLLQGALCLSWLRGPLLADLGGPGPAPWPGRCLQDASLPPAMRHCAGKGCSHVLGAQPTGLPARVIFLENLSGTVVVRHGPPIVLTSLSWRGACRLPSNLGWSATASGSGGCVPPGPARGGRQPRACSWNACARGPEPSRLHPHTRVHAHARTHTHTHAPPDRALPLLALLRTHLAHLVTVCVPAGARVPPGRARWHPAQPRLDTGRCSG